MNCIKLYKEGQLKKIKETLLEELKNCKLCPRNCGVNRLKNQSGFCRSGRFAKVNSFFCHFGEEPELVGSGGSGTIFFAYCNLACQYCQNYTLSHYGEGDIIEASELAKIMLTLQKYGAHNINFVTPTHIIAQILEALEIAIEAGLNLPLVYNCGGYEKFETLKLIDGIFDIYMPDIKYSDNLVAQKFSLAPNYWEVVQAAIREMHRQVGDLVIQNGIAKRGLLIRHLILPNNLGGSFKVLDFVRSLSINSYINIMDQYHPCYNAYKFSQINRCITEEEYITVIEYAKKIGLHRGFKII
ncbi:MAG: 4Fe-4S cluster-binding domain-containing protein [Candidatus Omnitrophica bacterium]|nr:4Fe-4S cluster-binding domain-containing protein [Candidatus Omnitrophota bacterium]